MGRELRRVPLDFDWPMNEVWKGYLTPEHLQFPKCPDCSGSGYGPEASAVADTFYPHQLVGPRADELAWHDKIGQAEVDNLIEQGRLRVWRDGEWRSEPRTAQEVNAAQRQRQGMNGHDGINRMILIRYRCERLGIPVECPTCAGHGDIASDSQREAADSWEGTEPPTGEGYQLWETTSEGSPISPVFDSLDALCDFAAEHCTVFGGSKTTAADWRRMLDEGFVRLQEGRNIFI